MLTYRYFYTIDCSFNPYIKRPLLPYSICFSSSDDTTDSDCDGRKDQLTVISKVNKTSAGSRQLPVASTSSQETPYNTGTGISPRYKEPVYGHRKFWTWQFNDDNNIPLKITNLPRFSANIANLELIAAAQYNGSLDLLPTKIANFVSNLRELKHLIFAAELSESRSGVLWSYEEYILCITLGKRIDEIKNNWKNEWAAVRLNFIWPYRLSLNGVLCGPLLGPEYINRVFVRWIHLRFGLFQHLRVRSIKRKWSSRGFKVYRFTPMPYVTVLRITLLDSKTRRTVLLHITRQPN